MPSILNSLKLLADPTRLRLVLLLAEEDLSVAELQEILGMGQSRISTQLAQLKKEGLVTNQRSGKNNIYSATSARGAPRHRAQGGKRAPGAPPGPGLVAPYPASSRKDRARVPTSMSWPANSGGSYVPGRSWKALAEGLLKHPQL